MGLASSDHRWWRSRRGRRPRLPRPARRPRCSVAAGRGSPRSGPCTGRGAAGRPQLADAPSQAAPSDRSDQVVGLLARVGPAQAPPRRHRVRWPAGARRTDGTGRPASPQDEVEATDARAGGARMRSRSFGASWRRATCSSRTCFNGSSSSSGVCPERNSARPRLAARGRYPSAPPVAVRLRRRRARPSGRRSVELDGHASEPVQMAQAQPLVRPEEEAAPPGGRGCAPRDDRGPGCATQAPGQFEVDEEAIERALERTLVQEGVLLLPLGQAEIEPSFTYTRREFDVPTVVVQNGDDLRWRAGASAQRVRDQRRAQGRPALGFADRSRHPLQLCRRGRHDHGRRSAPDQQQRIRSRRRRCKRRPGQNPAAGGRRLVARPDRTGDV